MTISAEKASGKMEEGYKHCGMKMRGQRRDMKESGTFLDEVVYIS